MKKIFRKPRPAPDHQYWLDTDCCWFCNCYGRGCSGCKKLKEYAKEKSKHKRKEEKEKLRRQQEDYNY